MFAYYLRLAMLSLKRNPVLTGLMVVAIGLGIGAVMTTVTLTYSMGANPIPHKSDQLYYVQLDNWAPDDPFGSANDMPDLMTYKDSKFLGSEQDEAFRQAAMFPAAFLISTMEDGARLSPEEARVTNYEFFEMFDVPFAYGGPWGDQAEEDYERVLVISDELNERVFGGENSVGRELKLDGEVFTIVGVLEPWAPVPRFYDIRNGEYDPPENLYIPFTLTEPMSLTVSGNNNCWQPPANGSIEAYYDSECVWTQTWVELPSQTARADYEDFLMQYVLQQKELGRFPRPAKVAISDVMAWLEAYDVVDDDAEMLTVMGFLFLLVCLLNTVALLLAKFLGRAGDIGVRRAVGASRRAIFVQHMIEAGLIGLLGGVLGLGLAQLGLMSLDNMVSGISTLVRMDWVMVSTAIALAILATLAAGLLPTWRAAHITPAIQLKSQ